MPKASEIKIDKGTLASHSSILCDRLLSGSRGDPKFGSYDILWFSKNNGINVLLFAITDQLAHNKTLEIDQNLINTIKKILPTDLSKEDQEDFKPIRSLYLLLDKTSRQLAAASEANPDTTDLVLLNFCFAMVHQRVNVMRVAVQELSDQLGKDPEIIKALNTAFKKAKDLSKQDKQKMADLDRCAVYSLGELMQKSAPIDDGVTEQRDDTANMLVNLVHDELNNHIYNSRGTEKKQAEKLEKQYMELQTLDGYYTTFVSTMYKAKKCFANGDQESMETVTIMLSTLRNILPLFQQTAMHHAVHGEVFGTAAISAHSIKITDILFDKLLDSMENIATKHGNRPR